MNSATPAVALVTAIVGSVVGALAFLQQRRQAIKAEAAQLKTDDTARKVELARLEAERNSRAWREMSESLDWLGKDVDNKRLRIEQLETQVEVLRGRLGDAEQRVDAAERLAGANGKLAMTAEKHSKECARQLMLVRKELAKLKESL